MGVVLEHVLSDSRHHGAFVCAVCQNIADLDCLVTTVCSHCFCKQCLSSWLGTNKTTCPTCNQDLLYTSNNGSNNGQFMMMGSQSVLVQPLERAQPLAHRLLKSIAVQCPMRKSICCQWQGDYGDLQTHLLSGTAHGGGTTCSPAPATKTTTAAAVAPLPNTNANSKNDESMQRKKNVSLAASLKAEANAKFETKHYGDANSLYTKAISVLNPYFYGSISDDTNMEDEDSSNVVTLLSNLYSNRAASHLQMQKYQLCLDDCNHVLHKLDGTNIKVYVRATNACVQMGRIETAVTFLTQALQNEPNNPIVRKKRERVKLMLKWIDLGNGQLDKHQYASAKTTFSHLLKEAPSAISFLLGAARSDIGLGLTDSALRLTKRILTQHAQNPQGCWARGQVLFLMGDHELSIRLLQEALRLDPDSRDIKASLKSARKTKELIDEAQQRARARNFSEAVDLLSDALEQYRPSIPPKAPIYATLHTQRAEARLRLKRYTEALKDCALVLYAQEDHIPAWLVRFQAHHGRLDHETALTEAKDLLNKFPQNEQLRTAYERADFLVRKHRRVDYYELLGCRSIASELEIKKAYKAKALEMHPDKVPPGATEEQRQDAQRKFQLLGEALEILSDDFTRKLYDDGYDPEAIRQRVEAAKQAANRSHGGHPHHPHYR